MFLQTVENIRRILWVYTKQYVDKLNELYHFQNIQYPEWMGFERVEYTSEVNTPIDK